MPHHAIPQLGAERPSYPVIPPALARHTLFRLTNANNPRWVSEPEERAERWRALCAGIETYCNEARRAFGAATNIKFVPPNERDNPAEEIYSTQRSALITLTRETPDKRPAYRARMRVDVHTETFTITHIMDNFDLDSKDAVAQRVDALIKGDNDPYWLFDAVWTSDECPFSKLRHEAMVFEMFAVFHGVIIPTSPDGVMTAVADNSAERSRKDAPLQASQWTEGQNVEPWMPAARFFHRRRKLVDQILAGMPASGAPAVDSEAVVCGMIDGNALYASPLVSWNRSVRHLRYFAAFAGDSAAQLGRFIRRLHIMGELRHFALLDLDKSLEGDSDGALPKDLKRVSYALKIIGTELDRLIGDGGTVKLTDLTEINKQMTALHQHTEGGLFFRIEQSKYYASSFRMRIQDLRVVRIEGWQPYDEFVRRYIYQLFDKIESIGERYKILGRRLDRSIFLAEVKSSEDYYDQIKDNTKQITNVTGNMRLLQDQTKALLATAEKFALIFAVYYIGTIIEKMVPPKGIEHKIMMVVWVGLLALIIVDVWLFDEPKVLWFAKRLRDGLRHAFGQLRNGARSFLNGGKTPEKPAKQLQSDGDRIGDGTAKRG